VSVTPTVEPVTTGERAAWVQAWASIITVVLTFAGLFFVIRQINFAKEQYLAYKAERTTERLERFYSDWTSPTMMAYRANAANNYPSDSVFLKEVFSFFERLAIAKKKGIVSGGDVDEYFQDAMLAYWCGFDQVVKQDRIRSGEDPATSSLWREFENAVGEKKKRNGANCFAQAELTYFMEMEKDRYLTLSALNAPAPQAEPAGAK
jgi:hypothetical protein